jgi:hypothetical protein
MRLPLMSMAFSCGVELLLEANDGTLLESETVVPTWCKSIIEEPLGSPKALWTLDDVELEIFFTLGFCTLLLLAMIGEL